MEKKWYDKTHWIIIVSVIFFPVGAFLIWRVKDGFFASAERKKKGWVSLGLIWLFIIIVGRVSEANRIDAVEKQLESGPISEKVLDELYHLESGAKKGLIEKYNAKIAKFYIDKSLLTQSIKEFVTAMNIKQTIKLDSTMQAKLVDHMQKLVKGEIEQANEFDSFEELLKIAAKYELPENIRHSISAQVTRRKSEAESEKPAIGGGEAARYCKESVENRLKSPSSADFAEGFMASAKMTQNTKTQTVYVYNSYVDAANSFNAKLRTRFSCTVTVQKSNGKVYVNVSL